MEGFAAGIWKNGNEKPVWNRNKVGPSNVEKGWRLVRDNTTGIVDIFLFGGAKGLMRLSVTCQIQNVWPTKFGKRCGESMAQHHRMLSTVGPLTRYALREARGTAMMIRKNFHHRHLQHHKM